MLCLRCGSVAPRDAVFCECGRSFGCRLCGSRHQNPLHATRCFQCGRTELTEGTPFISLRPISRLIAWSAVFLVIRWGLHHALILMRASGSVATSLLEHGLGFRVSSLLGGVYCLIGWYVVILILTAVIPKHIGGPVRSGLNRLIRFVLRYGWKALIRIVHGIWMLLEGKGSKQKGGRANEK